MSWTWKALLQDHCATSVEGQLFWVDTSVLFFRFLKAPKKLPHFWTQKTCRTEKFPEAKELTFVGTCLKSIGDRWKSRPKVTHIQFNRFLENCFETDLISPKAYCKIRKISNTGLTHPHQVLLLLEKSFAVRPSPQAVSFALDTVTSVHVTGACGIHQKQRTPWSPLRAAVNVPGFLSCCLLQEVSKLAGFTAPLQTRQSKSSQRTRPIGEIIWWLKSICSWPGSTSLKRLT